MAKGSGIYDSHLMAYPDAQPFAERIAKIAARGPTELTSLYDEIAVMKVMACDVLQIAARAGEVRDPAQRLTVYKLASDQFGAVAARMERLATAAAKIDNLNAISHSVHFAKTFMDHVERLAEALLPSTRERERFIAAMRQSVTITGENDPISVDSRIPQAEMSAMDSLTAPSNRIN
jgi:hypothetical protein